METMPVVESSSPSASSSSELRSEKVKLRKEVSLLDCVALTAGTIVGSGIFISPKGVLVNTGMSVGWSLIVWVASGVLSSMGALSYAQLATTITKSGGDYAFLNEGFVPLLGFLRLWTIIVSVRTGAFTVLSITAAKYMLAPFFYGCENPPIMAERLIAACVLCAVFFLNSSSVRWSERVQIIFSLAKYVALSVIIIAGIAVLCQGHTENFKGAFKSEEDADYSKLPLAFYSALFAYGGWQYLPMINEEIVNPTRNIPCGLIISMVMVCVAYTLTNVAYFAVLTPAEIIASPAVAVDFGQRVLGSWWWLLAVGVSFSCIGSCNGGLFTTSRVLFAASREGHLPKIVAMIHVRRFSPLPAAVVLLPICLLMLTSNNVYQLLNYMSFSRWAFIAIAVLVIPYQRWKYPDKHRPFKIPVIIPILFSLCAMFVVVMSLYSAPLECGIGLAITLAGIPVYLVGVKWKNKPEWMDNSTDAVTAFLQKLFLVILQEEKTY